MECVLLCQRCYLCINLTLCLTGIPLPKKPRLAPPAPEKNAGTGIIDRSDPEKFCQLCNATFNNPHMAQQHYAGKKHKKQETKNKLMTIYTSCGNALPQSTPLKPLTPGSASSELNAEPDTEKPADI